MSQASWSAADYQYMSRALQLAAKGMYSTHPNPRVGCVLVKDGTLVAEGWHRKAGEAHAEVNALRAAGERARGATAYVTLEPCSHQGRTGACAEALVKAGVGRVIAAMQDPNPLVAGRGFEILRRAGIACEHGLLVAQAQALNPGFISRMQRQRPYVRVKLASSLDGRTAMASGESKWITGAAARADVQGLRARSSAIVTAAGTVAYDNPAMTVRAEELTREDARAATERQPLRIVLDDNATLNGNEQIFTEPGPVMYCVRKGAAIRSAMPSKAHIQLVHFEREASREQCLRQLLARLSSEHECNELLVEAGPGLAGAFLQAGLVDELWVYMAPKLMGSEAKPLAELPLQRMADCLQLTLQDVTMLGDDLRLRYQLAGAGGR